MGRSKASQSESSSGVEIRQRVTKACQRCRLKKCKCDGLSPCSRCRSDDAICAYIKHQQFDKIVYRKGYVQMLERQQAQLIAGVQTFHSITQKGERLPAGPLESNNRGQPLVHQILQRLGVLEHDDPWDEIDPEEAKSELSPTELDSTVDTNFSPEQHFLWPGEAISCGPLDGSLSPSQAWTSTSAVNPTLLPWITAAGRFLDLGHSESRALESSSAATFSTGDTSQRSCLGASAIGHSRPGPPLQPDAHYPATYSAQFHDPTKRQSAPSSLDWPVGWEGLMGMIGEGNEQHLYIQLADQSHCIGRPGTWSNLH